MDFKSTTEEMVALRVNPTTKGGQPSSLDGAATVTILTGGADFRLPTAQEAADDAAAGKTGLVGYLRSENAAGVSTFQVSGDADLGAGVETITDGGTYTYNAPNAANLGLGGDVVAKS